MRVCVSHANMSHHIVAKSTNTNQHFPQLFKFSTKVVMVWVGKTDSIHARESEETIYKKHRTKNIDNKLRNLYTKITSCVIHKQR